MNNICFIIANRTLCKRANYSFRIKYIHIYLDKYNEINMDQERKQ